MSTRMTRHFLMGRRILQPLMGRRVLQPLWEQLHGLALHGMNIHSGATNVSDSGELWVIDYFGQHLPSDGPATVFDVGANTGRYAREVVSQFGDRVRLYCFEPAAKAFGLLRSNLGDCANVELYDFGFGDKEQFVTLYANAGGSGLASIYKRRLDHFGITMKHTERIHLVTLDVFCNEQGIEHIDFLKLDVEGHELKVLEGAQGLIDANRIHFIQFEFGGCNIDSRTYFQDLFYLLNERYKIRRILLDGLTPIEAYQERYEIFVPANYLAISRRI